MKSVAAAEASALAAWRVFHAGDRVGAIVFNDTDVTEIAPHRSRSRVMQILQAIIKKNHALSAETPRPANPHMINTALSRAVRLAKHDCLVCLIAGGGGADEETVRLCTQLAAHNDVVVLFVYDPMEAALPAGGQLVFADGDLQMEVDGRDTRLKKASTRNSNSG